MSPRQSDDEVTSSRSTYDVHDIRELTATGAIPLPQGDAAHSRPGPSR